MIDIAHLLEESLVGKSSRDFEIRRRSERMGASSPRRSLVTLMSPATGAGGARVLVGAGSGGDAAGAEGMTGTGFSAWTSRSSTAAGTLEGTVRC
jgi:hypothetical protein